MKNFIETRDLEKFKKAGAKNIIELSLIAPVKYLNLIPQKFPVIGIENFVEVTVKDVAITPKYMKIFAYAKNFEKDLEILFFRYQAYHKKLFFPGAVLSLYGKVVYGSGKLQMLHPKKVSFSGQIVPVYKTALRADIFRNLCKKYITKNALLAEGLPETYAARLEDIHNPSLQFYKNFTKNRTFPKSYLEALKFAEIYNHLKELGKKRVFFPALKRLNCSSEDFIKNLPFELTADQKSAIKDIENDLKKEVAAKRVIVGDVGCGKSIVMFAAAFMAFPERALLMAPTTVLANQLYEEALKFIPSKIKCTLVTGSNKPKNLEEYHFIIGTHALLYQKLPEAVLVMTDEQHRFGTSQRHALEKMVSFGKKRPHFLQFSATPIPRTQALIDSALVDITLIKETPFKKDIDTKIITKDEFGSLLLHIKSEIEQKRQVLIVYPLVEESENFRYKSLEEAQEFWKKHFENVYSTHGKDREKERILVEFREKGDILLATTVIEVGISLPRLSTVVIVGAENLGLATLHQLRGRVSRTGLKGYCFLYTNNKKSERLRSFAKVKSGFEIAELDLKFRKGGDILSGKNQSGKSFRWIDIVEDKDIIEEAKRLIK
ncbi:ATP-dependent DNA helicase RecG [Nitrosophilus alvini]|uniref:ATP-dependent DNA helicase RecG n=1 Tax=Nitrosophilus alvini TaxID=2714855 RepID=UPI001F2BD666|nr:ATP-dependent DNA helicase RecG [Nitrosophilus alvini]